MVNRMAVLSSQLKDSDEFKKLEAWPKLLILNE